MKNADATALVLVPVGLAVGLWATLEAFGREGIDSELATTIEQLLAINFELAGMLLILLVIGWLLASDGVY